jgi:hypothetical protein
MEWTKNRPPIRQKISSPMGKNGCQMGRKSAAKWAAIPAKFDQILHPNNFFKLPQ